jgi:hypothetical protein
MRHESCDSSVAVVERMNPKKAVVRCGNSDDLAYLGEMCGIVSLVEWNEEARQSNRHWWKMITYFHLLITRNAWFEPNNR